MPFAELPSSQGFAAPQAPDWTKFAAQANEFIARQPIPDTASAVKDAVAQIDQILKESSPEAKMERGLKMMQMQNLMEMYRDYKVHPEKYKPGPNGLPVLVDPVERGLKMSQIRRNNAAAVHSLTTDNSSAQIDALRKRFQDIRANPNAYPHKSGFGPGGQPLGQGTTDESATNPEAAGQAATDAASDDLYDAQSTTETPTGP
jgi:hypothetical protein